MNMAGLREGLLTVGPANVTIPTFENNLNSTNTPAFIPWHRLPSLQPTRTSTSPDATFLWWHKPITASGSCSTTWCRTNPWSPKGWNMLFRLYGLLDPWLNKTWKLNEIEQIK